MALRSPIYLDRETLLAQAEYHDIEVPRQMDVVEKTVRKRSGGGKFGVSGVGLDASAGTDVEHQSTYSLQPRDKATVSKVIDALIVADAVQLSPGADGVLSKDDLVEIEGQTHITAASLAGKLFFILRRLINMAEGDLPTLLDLDAKDPHVAEQLKQVYLRNELLPIPVLLGMANSGLAPKVFINVRPDHFIDSASANRIEGEVRVLGTVSHIIDGGDEGYFSAEEWLLHEWEYLLRRKLMPQLEDSLKPLIQQLDIDLAAEDVHAYIAGPAVVIDAIALY